ncbi:MAG: SDR family NAD(P)-dependent oxidoreductase [Candidatus Thiodiazotropha sp. L084R]
MYRKGIQNMQDLSEKSLLPTKIAWITGGGSGIGRSLALALDELGCKVLISGRNKERLEATAKQAGQQNVQSVPLDVTNPVAVIQTVDSILEQHGRIDLAFLNAGDYTPMKLNDFDSKLFHRLMNTNYLGVVNCLAALLPDMRSRHAGEILITASLSGYCGLPGAAPYGASKAALINLAESLHPELIREGVTLRLINPGFVSTDLTDKNEFKMPSLISPEEAAEEIMKSLPSRCFEIRFPTGFALVMKLIKFLPYRLYFALMRRFLK